MTLAPKNRHSRGGGNPVSFPLREASAAYRVWKRVRIGDALKLVNGRAFKPVEWSQQGLPIVRIQNLNNPDAPFNYYQGELPEKFRLREGDLLFAWSGTPGTSFGAHIWRGGDAWLNQHIFKVLFDEAGFEKRFLRYAINQNLNHYIAAAHGGAGLAHITKGKFESFEIDCPPLDEQRSIVAELETQLTRLDASVTALKRVQANLKRYRASVLKAACEGRLVLTEAELARGEGRSYESGAELLIRLQNDRSSSVGKAKKKLQQSAVAKMRPPAAPEGWAWATVEELAAITANSIADGPFGSNLKTEHYVKVGPRVIRLQNIGDGVFVDEHAHINSAHYERLMKHGVFAGDIVIATLGESPPRACIVPESLGPAIVKADCVRFKPHEALSAKFLGHMLNSEPTRARAKAIVHGIGRPRLNLGEIRSISLPLPPFAEQQRIVLEIERRLSVVEEVDAQIRANVVRSNSMRSSLLQLAFDSKLSEMTNGSE